MNWNWLRKLFGLPVVDVQIHMARFVHAPEQGTFIFVNISNPGWSTVNVTRVWVAEDDNNPGYEMLINKFPVYPGNSAEVAIQTSCLGLTQMFKPKNFKVQLATGQIFSGKIRKSVGNIGVMP